MASISAIIDASSNIAGIASLSATTLTGTISTQFAELKNMFLGQISLAASASSLAASAFFSNVSRGVLSSLSLSSKRIGNKSSIITNAVHLTAKVLKHYIYCLEIIATFSIGPRNSFQLSHRITKSLYRSRSSSWCKTCQNTRDKCPGHFGTVQLKFPVVNPLFRSEVLRWLRQICHHCSKLELFVYIVSFLLDESVQFVLGRMIGGVFTRVHYLFTHDLQHNTLSMTSAGTYTSIQSRYSNSNVLSFTSASSLTQCLRRYRHLH